MKIYSKEKLLEVYPGPNAERIFTQLFESYPGTVATITATPGQLTLNKEASIYITMVAPPWPVISRDEAFRTGLKTYFTGKPCKHGHLAPRYTSTGACAECARIYMRKHGRKHRGIDSAIRPYLNEVETIFRAIAVYNGTEPLNQIMDILRIQKQALGIKNV